MNQSKCTACGMPTSSAAEYHPHALCVLFQYRRDSEFAKANIRAVVEYGMNAQRLGISLHNAMNDISLVNKADTPKSEGETPCP